MALVDALDDEQLTTMLSRFRDNACKQRLGTKGRWTWTGKVLQARYCLAEDLISSLLDHATSGFSLLSEISAQTKPFVLFELWRVVWQMGESSLLEQQMGESSLLEQVAQETDNTDGALWESRLYANFVLRGSLPAGLPPVKDMGAALVLPRDEAVGLVAETAWRSVASALSAPDSGRAVAALGPFGWGRGVAWARRRLDGVDIVPAGLEHLFYGPPTAL
jgi:hypothetical protein